MYLPFVCVPKHGTNLSGETSHLHLLPSVVNHKPVSVMVWRKEMVWQSSQSCEQKPDNVYKQKQVCKINTTNTFIISNLKSFPQKNLQ